MAKKTTKIKGCECPVFPDGFHEIGCIYNPKKIVIENLYQKFMIKVGDIEIPISIDQKYMTIVDKDGFVFMSKKSPDKLKLWGQVIAGLACTMPILKKKLKEFE